MILAAGDVVDLQFFLMDGAKRYVDASAGDSGDLLASAAALDYALLLASEHGNEVIDNDAPIAVTIRETMTRASLAALHLIERLLGAPDVLFNDFVDRHIRHDDIFDVLRALRMREVVRSRDVAFRVLTATSDTVERRQRL